MTALRPFFANAASHAVRARRRTLRAAALLGLAVAASAGAAGLLAFPIDAFRPMQADGQNAPAVQGLWSLAGHGYLVDVAANEVAAYSTAGGLCWPEPGFAEAASTFYYAQSSRRAHAAFALHGDGFYPNFVRQYHGGRRVALPAACTADVDRAAPAYVFEAVASTLIEHYAFGAERGVDWAPRAAALRPRAQAARTDAELKAVLADLFAGVEDPHLAIQGVADDAYFEIGTPAKATNRRLAARAAQAHSAAFGTWFAAWRNGQQQRVETVLERGSVRKDLSDALLWGRLDGNVGYLAIESEGGYEPDADDARDRALLRGALDRALTDLAGTRALVLDVSNNSGGSYIYWDIAARFADRSRRVLTFDVPSAAGVAPQSGYLLPSARIGYRKPVYLLTSEITLSAGEHLALALRTLPNVVQIGQPTHGAFSPALVKTLPNGWMLSLSNAVVRDARGVGYETRGLPPAIPFEVYPTSASVPDAVFDAGRADAVRYAARLARWR